VPTPAIIGVAHHFGAFHNLTLHRMQGARAVCADYKGIIAPCTGELCVIFERDY